MSIWIGDGGVIQRQTSDVESQQNMMARCHEGRGKKVSKNKQKTGFS